MQCCGMGRQLRRLEMAFAEQQQQQQQNPNPNQASSDVPPFVTFSAAVPCVLDALDGRVARVVALVADKLCRIDVFLPQCSPSTASRSPASSPGPRRVTSSSIEPLIIQQQQKQKQQQQQQTTTQQQQQPQTTAAAAPQSPLAPPSGKVLWLPKGSYHFVRGACEADLFVQARCRKQDSLRVQLIESGLLFLTQSADERMVVKINKTPRTVNGGDKAVFSFA